jgi:hypothetical protein
LRRPRVGRRAGQGRQQSREESKGKKRVKVGWRARAGRGTSGRKEASVGRRVGERVHQE